MIAIMSMTFDEIWNTGARERRLGVGEFLFHAGDPVRFLYRVESGVMRLVRPLPHGAELIVQRAAAQVVLAEASLFAAHYHCDAIAVADSCLQSIPVARVTEAIGRDPELACSFAQYLALEVQRARARAEIVSLRTVGDRLDAWLALNGDVLLPRGRWREVAGEIGVTPEALYRELARRRVSEAGILSSNGYPTVGN
jgi:CRP-like cAMP-binding protein